jgi:GNAT superfamily N-acetyltransferase
MDVVQATTDDYETISTLWKELNEHHAQMLPDRMQSYAGVGRSEEVINRWNNGDDRVIYLATKNKQAVGFVNLWMVDVEDKNMTVGVRYAQLGNIFVRSSSRRRGIAKKLMERATQWSREQNATRLELQVYNQNPSAIAMYTELGFQPYMQKFEFVL